MISNKNKFIKYDNFYPVLREYISFIRICIVIEPINISF